MMTEAQKHRVYIDALLIAFRVSKDGRAAYIELPDEESSKLRLVLLDKAGADTALRAILGDAACRAMDEGQLSPPNLETVAFLIADRRGVDTPLH